MNLSFGVVNRSSSSSSRIELFLRWSNKNTWNTVRQDCKKVSKWLRESSDPASENLPPKICIPNNEKINMKRNRIISKEFIDEMEFTRDFTKLPIEDQYLQHMCLGHLPLLIYRSICLVVVNKFTYSRTLDLPKVPFFLSFDVTLFFTYSNGNCLLMLRIFCVNFGHCVDRREFDVTMSHLSNVKMWLHHR